VSVMSDSPLVSVILTSYNYEAFVEEAIQSVYNQTYFNIELIVVDDGSTDGSEDVIESLVLGAPFSVTTIYLKHSGQAGAFNAGFEKATGEIVCFLDSDDSWYPEKVRRVVDFIQAFSDGGVYQHPLDTGHGLKRGGMLSGDVFGLWKGWSGGVFNVADASVGLLFNPFVPTTGLVFRKEILDTIFPVPEQLTTCIDGFLTRAAAAYGPLYSIPMTLGIWRDHGGNAGVSSEFGFEDFWVPVLLPALNDYFEKNGLGLELKYEPGTRSRIPADQILGQLYSMLDLESGEAFREQVSRMPELKSGILGRLLRVFLPESKVRAIRRFFRK